MQLIAKTLSGLEDVLSKELHDLGAKNIRKLKRAVLFEGNKATLYKANFYCRTAIRVLVQLTKFEIKSVDDLYYGALRIPWNDFFSVDKTFAIYSNTQNELFNNSMFASLKVKDAIADYFRKRTGKRPDVDTNFPDLVINVHVSRDRVVISLDSSGVSLHKRGYRVTHTEANLSEVLAAGMVLISGWNDDCDLIDPMCGSATIPIEAALIAKNIPPGIFRKSFAFERWNDFDADLLTDIAESYDEKPLKHKIIASDISKKVLLDAEKNIKNAGLFHDIQINGQDFFHIKELTEPALFVMNPPYGERLKKENLLEFYQKIGSHLKHNNPGHIAWILSNQEVFFHQIGLRASEKHRLFNGPIECQFRKYELFAGKRK